MCVVSHLYMVFVIQPKLSETELFRGSTQSPRSIKCCYHTQEGLACLATCSLSPSMLHLSLPVHIRH